MRAIREGWALGTLKFVPGTEIQRPTPPAICCPTIILLTDGVPAEVPSVAGIVSLMPSTPNSHVAILSRSQGVPFVHLAVESDAAQAQALVGHSVYLAVTQDEFAQSCAVKLLDVGFLIRRGEGVAAVAQEGAAAGDPSDDISRPALGGHERPASRRHRLLRRQGLELRHPASGRCR